jgi:imidazoleglycerol-phosphate dehydratase
MNTSNVTNTSDTTVDATSAGTVVERATRETRIHVELRRGAGSCDSDTGISFLDHMMATFARYSGLDLVLRASGDMRHHTIEDVAIAMGIATGRIMGASTARYGNRTIPMDDALVQVCVDMGGRPYYQGPLPSKLYDHWIRSFADNARATIHVRVLRGSDRHHIVEAAFKALALAVRDAMTASDTNAVFSTKGDVSVEVQ